MDINSKDKLEIYVDGDSIVLKKHQFACSFCGSCEDVVNFKDHCICKKGRHRPDRLCGQRPLCRGGSPAQSLFHFPRSQDGDRHGVPYSPMGTAKSFGMEVIHNIINANIPAEFQKLDWRRHAEIIVNFLWSDRVGLTAARSFRYNNDCTFLLKMCSIFGCA